MVCESPKQCVSKQAFTDATNKAVALTCAKALTRAEKYEEAIQGERDCVRKLDQARGQIELLKDVDAERLKYVLKYREAQIEADSKWSTFSLVLFIGVSTAVGIGSGILIGSLAL